MATVTVTGRAEVRVRPDRAVVRGRVEVRANEREESLHGLRRAQAAVVDGTAATVVFDQVRSWSGQEGRGTVHLHSASFHVELDDVDVVAATVDALLGLGAEVSHTSWDVAEDNPAHRRARIAAVADAERRATDYAVGLGRALGAVSRLTDGSAAAVAPPLGPRRMAAGNAEAPDLQLAPDTVPVSAVAEVTWELATDPGGSADGR